MSARRSQIIACAVNLANTGGASALSMRALAAALNVRPMTLYYYVPNKAVLLNLIVAEVAEQIAWTSAPESPRDELVSHALDVYQALATNSWIPDVLRASTQAGAPPILVAEPFIASARGLGFAEADAVGLWRATWFLISSQLQSLGINAGTTPTVQAPASAEMAGLAVYVRALIDGMIITTLNSERAEICDLKEGLNPRRKLLHPDVGCQSCSYSRGDPAKPPF
nr:TetR/AcrR family transcriptional regulator [Gordonia desulfuricans]